MFVIQVFGLLVALISVVVALFVVLFLINFDPCVQFRKTLTWVTCRW